MSDSEDMIKEFMEQRYLKLKPGAEHTMFHLYCTACEKYNGLSANPPFVPGGVLDCPYCRHLKQNRWLEGCHGHVLVKQFKIKLPDDLSDMKQ